MAQNLRSLPLMNGIRSIALFAMMGIPYTALHYRQVIKRENHRTIIQYSSPCHHVRVVNYFQLKTFSSLSVISLHFFQK
jgi:hypothetical protein